MKAAGAACLALAIAMSSGAAAQSPGPLFDDADGKPVGSPMVVIAPKYPKAALERGQTGHVDVEGVVNTVGGLVEPVFAPDSPASAVFVEAVRDVLHEWIFYPYLGTDCQPTPRPVRLRVWFEIEGGKGKISLTRPVAEHVAQRERLKRVSGADPIYPMRMLSAAYEADVYARVELEDDGSVRAVTAEAYPERYRRHLESFAFVVKDAVMGWKYPPRSKEDAGPRSVCVSVSFRLRK